MKKTNLLKHPTRRSPFSASRCAKKTGNVDLKMGPKMWIPFWGPRKEKTVRRTPKRSRFCTPFQGSHCPCFSLRDAGKKHMLFRMFVSRFLVLTTTCSGTGEDCAEGASFCYAFLTLFWGPKKFFFSKETMLKPMSSPKSDTRQAQQKLTSNLAQQN